MGRLLALSACVVVSVAEALRCGPSWRRGPVRSPRLRGAGGAASGEWDLVLFSPAKVNLFLRVLRKREDGFHELASLFQAVDLGDTLSFAELGGGEGEDDVLLCDAPGCPLDPGQEKGDSTSLQRGFFSKRFPRRKHPRFEFAPRDDRSSKHEPNRVENDRDARF